MAGLCRSRHARCIGADPSRRGGFPTGGTNAGELVHGPVFGRVGRARPKDVPLARCGLEGTEGAAEACPNCRRAVRKGHGSETETGRTPSGTAASMHVNAVPRDIRDENLQHPPHPHPPRVHRRASQPWTSSRPFPPFTPGRFAPPSAHRSAPVRRPHVPRTADPAPHRHHHRCHGAPRALPGHHPGPDGRPAAAAPRPPHLHHLLGGPPNRLGHRLEHLSARRGGCLRHHGAASVGLPADAAHDVRHAGILSPTPVRIGLHP